jgi:predicted TIM-barrel fold metal-dependent hydrolase
MEQIHYHFCILAKAALNHQSSILDRIDMALTPAMIAELVAAPLCAGADPHPRQPELPLPPHACDCHAHVCGPWSRYPYAAARIYTPPDALPSAYLAMLATVGVERCVLIQPSVYGTDNRAMLDAMAQIGNRSRGVAVVDDNVNDEELQRLHTAGIRGVRVNVVDVKENKGVIDVARLARFAQRLRPLGWHVEFLMHADELPQLDRLFADFPVDIVLGHLGYMRTDKGLFDPGFQALLHLMRDARAWVKLTGPYRITTGALPYADVTPYAHALIEAAPQQVIWGTDWPHVMVKSGMPNDGDLADLLATWIPDAGLREQVLVKNPERLYGF